MPAASRRPTAGGWLRPAGGKRPPPPAGLLRRVTGEYRDDDEQRDREPTDDAIVVLGDLVAVDAAEKDRCPSCELEHGIRFLGAGLATLASVAITRAMSLAGQERFVQAAEVLEQALTLHRSPQVDGRETTRLRAELARLRMLAGNDREA